MNKTHKLKTHPEHFQKVWDGIKTFEIRRDDRGFEIGDTVILDEYDPDLKIYLSRSIQFPISDITRDVYKFGLRRNYCILSFQRSGVLKVHHEEKSNIKKGGDLIEEESNVKKAVSHDFGIAPLVEMDINCGEPKQANLSHLVGRVFRITEVNRGTLSFMEEEI